MSIATVQCYGKCRHFYTLRGMYFLDGHVYCENDKPEGAKKIVKVEELPMEVEEGNDSSREN